MNNPMMGVVLAAVVSLGGCAVEPRPVGERLGEARLFITGQCTADLNTEGSRVIRVTVVNDATRVFERDVYVYRGDRRPIYWQLCDSPGYAFDASRGIEVKPWQEVDDLKDCMPHGGDDATVFRCSNEHRRAATIAYAVRLRSTSPAHPDPRPLDPFIHNQ